jgi:hypothetical protein
MKSFLEFWNQVKEDTLGKPDPLKLSTIDPNLAKASIASGQQDNNKQDDVVLVGQGSAAANKLKPSQKEIILIKAFNMAMNTKPFGGKFDVGGNLGSIMSKDNYIVDGHHRWAATMLVDQNANITATQINLPGPELISALNIWTKANDLTGNKGQGAISEFNGNNIQKNIIDVAKQTGKSPDSPDNKAPGYTWEELQNRITQFGQGDFDKGLNILKTNADKVGATPVESWCPERVEMPVIDEKRVKEVADAIAAGQIDIKPPFSPATQAAMGNKQAAPAGQQQAQSQMAGQQQAQPQMAGQQQAPTAPQLQAASMFYDDETFNELKVLAGVVIRD